MNFQRLLQLTRVLLAAVCVLAASASVRAETLVVNSTGDDGSGSCTPTKCTLRDAFLNLHAAIPTMQITFSLPANSTIVLTGGTLPLNYNVAIIGPGASSLTIARSSTAAHFRILDIAAGRSADISGVTISNGVDDLAESAGAIHNAGQLSLTGCTISGNIGNTEGGAIFNTGTVNVISSTISGNTGAFRGGAVCNSGSSGGASAILTVTNSTISGNSARTGAGIQNGGPGFASKLTITNSTISGNTAASAGGGILNNSTDSSVGVTIANSTISGNTMTAASSNGGGIYNESGKTCKLFSTIVARNTATTGPDVYSGSAVTSLGYNLIGNNQNTNMAAGTGDQIGTPANPIDPLLGQLRDNGGPTQTQELLTNSPALDKGNTAGQTSDQRGFTRPVDTPAIPNAGDGTDVGAYEVQADQLQGCPSAVVSNVNDTGTGSLRGVIAGACGGSTITFGDNVRGAVNLTSGELVLNKNLIIEGPGANLLTVQRSASASTNFRIFNITGNFRDTISGLTISNGTAPGNKGGGILSAGTLTLSNDTVSLNSAIGGNGGGIYSSGKLNVVGSTISGNKIDSSAPGSGGGIFNFGGSVTVNTSTISGNSAVSPGASTDHGGGIYSNTGIVLLITSTITANKADNGGGILGENGASLSASSTIIAGNTSPSGPDVKGPLTSNDYNLVGNNAQATITPNYGEDQIGTPASPIDPLLDSLQDNGGPTFTHALKAGSPAIDKGSASASGSTTDQRGLPRIYDDPGIPNNNFGDGSDIGAFEVQPPPPTPTPVPTPTPTPARLAQISTRMQVEVGDNRLFGGFIITGSDTKRLMVRAIGPTVNVPGNLQNPTLELYSGNTQIAANDNWVDAANKQEIIDSGIAPMSDLESAILIDLQPGSYTALIGGVNETTGVGLVEVYDLSLGANSKLAQISTRGLVGTGDNVMFGGFFVSNAAQKVIIRAIGPSSGLAGALVDPTLELHDGNGALLTTNDNWVDAPNKQEIIDSTVAPQSDFESAILQTLVPGAYTAIVRGSNDTTGIALVEVYALQ